MKLFLKLLLTVFVANYGFAQTMKPIAKEVAKAHTARKTFVKVSPFTRDNVTRHLSEYQKYVSDVTVMKLKDNELQKIVQEKPEALELTFPFESGNVTLELVKVNLFTNDFKVKTDKGEFAYTPGVYYQGIVKGDNKSIAAFSFFENEVVGIASQEDLGNIVLGKTKTTEEYVSYNDFKLKAKNPFACGVDELPENQLTQISHNPNVVSHKDASDSCIRIYYEVGYGPYTQNGSNVTNTTNWVTAVFNNVKALYTNESVRVVISEMFIWTSTDPYSGTPSNILNQFRTNRPTFNGDLGQLLRTPATTSVAWVNAICGTYKYSYCGVNNQNIAVPTYSWNVEAMTHELGHNLGSPHTHACAWNGNNTAIDGCGPASGNDEGCDGPLPTATKGTIMSYCHLVSSVGISFANGFGPQPGDLIRNTIASKACLGTDCETSCAVTVNSISVASTTSTSATININDNTATQWSYRLSLPDGTVVKSGTTTTKPLVLDGLSPKTFYKIEIGSDCSAAFQKNAMFLTDADNWCGSVITDTGGETGNYTINESWTKTFYPQNPDQKLKITFEEFNLAAGDYLVVRNGLSTSPAFAGTLTGNTIQGPFQSTHSTGAITLTFKSGNNTAPGFKAVLDCLVLGVSDVAFNKGFAVSPNPVKSLFKLEGKQAVKSVVLYDASGKLVKQFDQESISRNQYDVSKLKSGVYVLSIKTDNDTVTSKLIKE